MLLDEGPVTAFYTFGNIIKQIQFKTLRELLDWAAEGNILLNFQEEKKEKDIFEGLW
jgi:hypothetical protein